MRHDCDLAVTQECLNQISQTLPSSPQTFNLGNKISEQFPPFFLNKCTCPSYCSQWILQKILQNNTFINKSLCIWFWWNSITWMASDCLRLNWSSAVIKLKKKKKHHTLFSYVAKLCRKGSRKFVTWFWVLVRAQVCDWNMTIPKFWHRRPWGKINLRKKNKNNNNMGPAKNAG